MKRWKRQRSSRGAVEMEDGRQKHKVAPANAQLAGGSGDEVPLQQI